MTPEQEARAERIAIMLAEGESQDAIASVLAAYPELYGNIKVNFGGIEI